MRELVLLILAAAWLAVLAPPFLRSRVDNRPNSSVTDFRSKLNKLQSTVPGRATGSMRAAGSMGRPLAPSPLHRPAASGRPGAPAPTMRRGATRSHGDPSARNESNQRMRTHGPGREPAARRTRTHGAAGNGSAGAPMRRQRPDGYRVDTGRERRPTGPDARRAAGTRRPPVARRPDEELRRRRMNVLALLAFVTVGSLFLAKTTAESALLYVFAMSFIALVGYIYMLSQSRQREASGWPNDWMR